MLFPFVGRTRHVATLREQLSGRTPSLVMVRGTPGVGVSRFLREALHPLPHLLFPVPPLPDPDIRELLHQALRGRLPETGRANEGGGPPGDWSDLLALATAPAPAPAPEAGAPFTLVLDDAHRIAGGRKGAPGLIVQAMGELAHRLIPFHLVVAGTNLPGMSAFSREEGGAPALDLSLPPLSPRGAGTLFSRWSPVERLTAWSVFGGNPRRLTLLNPAATLAAAIREVVLDSEGPLHRSVPTSLEGAFQAPARYAAVLRGIAAGANGWGAIAGGVPGLEGGARLGPYLRALEERGLVDVRASLDAPPGSRARRYDLPDPFVRFWFSLVLPHLPELAERGVAGVWERAVKPGLPDHLRQLLPRAVRSWLQEDCAPLLGSTARETGALWGGEHEIEVAGILRTGAAVYGSCRWGDDPLTEEDLRTLDGRIRRTRYGFTRETRHRLLVGRGEATHDLRSRVVRDPTLHLVGVRELVGQE